MRAMVAGAVVFIVGLLGAAGVARAQQRVVDDFEGPQAAQAWETRPSDGVAASVQRVDAGGGNHALRIDYDFQAGMGFVVVRRPLPMDLPANYRWTFRVRGQGPSNNFEFKLVDHKDEDVWWVNDRGYEWPAQWRDVQFRPRNLRFAWGPGGGKVIEKLGYLEFAIAAWDGGKGWVEIDDLTFEPLPPVAPPTKAPTVRGKLDAITPPDAQGRKGVTVRLYDGGTPGEDGRVKLEMFRRADHQEPSLVRIDVNMQERREVGGLVVDFDRHDYPVDYDVLVSDDNQEFQTLLKVRGAGPGMRWIPLKDAETLVVRLDAKKTSRGEGVIARRIWVLPPEEAVSMNALWTRAGADAPRGTLPRWTQRQQPYWTVVGVSGDDKEALFNTDGAIEVDKQAFTIEPMLRVGDRVVTWADVASTATLEDGHLPIPSVTWSVPGADGKEVATLRVTPVADGEENKSTLLARYVVTNTGAAPWRGELALGVRPFQVLPPWQDLKTVGGSARVDRVEVRREGPGRPTIVVNGDRVLRLYTPQRGGRIGASTFFGGEALMRWAAGDTPDAESAEDPTMRAASAVATWPLALEPGQSRTVVIGWGMHGDAGAVREWFEGGVEQQETLYADAFGYRVGLAKEAWTAAVNRVGLRLPPSARSIEDTFKTQQAYILINRDGPSIQPGSRTYERSWIRDGSLTGSALLATGHAEEVRRFIEWYAPYQYESGKVPCVVDRRGPDPVDEHDSHGQLIFALAEYHRYTGDRSTVERLYGHVERAVNHMEDLRARRMTEPYRSGPDAERAKFGLLPESISHEGYSAKPMHSYWDGFFAIRGYKDAAYLAGVLGRAEDRARFEGLLESYRKAQYDSIRLAMRNTGVDYVPGCAELGDFDAPSTAIAIWPGEELGRVPEPAMTRTFEKWWEFFQARRDGTLEWRDYTPYETRLIGAQVRLGKPERAWALMDFYMNDRRPQGWNQWAEVVWKDPATPRFIGDMPHTWCGSDWVNSVRSMFFYEKETELGSPGSIVLGAGLKPEWLSERDAQGDVPGVRLERWPSPHGAVTYTARADGAGDAVVELGEGLRPRPGLVEIRLPGFEPAVVDGSPGRVTLRRAK